MTDAQFRTAVVDLSTDSTTITSDPALLRGIFIQTANSAQAVPVKNGASGTTVFTIPASSSGGIWYECGDTRMELGITIDPDNSATGTISVVWKPLLSTE